MVYYAWNYIFTCICLLIKIMKTHFDNLIIGRRWLTIRQAPREMKEIVETWDYYEQAQCGMEGHIRACATRQVLDLKDMTGESTKRQQNWSLGISSAKAQLSPYQRWVGSWSRVTWSSSPLIFNEKLKTASSNGIANILPKLASRMSIKLFFDQ